MRRTYDVVIVGAGVAGATAGLLFAQRGLSTLVVDKKQNGSHHKALCTHFVQPAARPVLRKLAIERDIERAGGVPTKAAFWTSSGWIWPDGDYAIAGSDGSLLAYNIERRILDPLLTRRLERAAGVTVELAQTVRSPNRLQDGSWMLVLENATGGIREIGGRFLVAADGRTSPVAAALGNELIMKKENQRTCLFGYFENVKAPVENRSLFLLGAQEMAFLYPLGRDRALLAAYVPKTSRIVGDEESKTNALKSIFAQFPDLPDLSSARLASRLYGYSDYPNLARKPVHNGVAYIGDAALSLDPMSGVGCAFAMLMADMLVESVAPTIATQPDRLDAALLEYVARFNKFFPAHASGIAADSIIVKSAATTDSVYRRITRNTYLQRLFIALTGRIIQPEEFQKAYLSIGLAQNRRSA
ncbi:NAD(P)/FAD-dependent oxidoreductase [uncultured Bradyrhizobium sp.]|uniref:NAD(P)/FAD-dependent oxidoreductase n=1 Tax=uncultured Bradyrhizobium sp. TaxID=199684 RepID=UPI0035C97885